MNQSREQRNKSLPRIKSQRRVYTTLEKKDTQGQSYQASQKGVQSGQYKQHTIQRTLSSARVSKAMRCQATGAIYVRKIQQIRKKNMMLNQEIKNIEQEINILRNQHLNKVRKQEYLNQTDQSQLTNLTHASYRKNININDPKSLKNQIKLTQNKIDGIRKRIDKENDKNKIIQNQINNFRKQITTIKNVNNELQISLNKVNEEYQKQLSLSKQLDQLIAQKNSFLHKRKIQSLHNKAMMIKQYDNILKTLDKQIENDKLSANANQQNKGNNFYMTEIGAQLNNQKKNYGQLPTNKRKSGIYSINNIKAKLLNYQHQFQILKQQTGTSNADQITQLFLKRYEQNFEEYKFIQQLYNNLNQLKDNVQELKNRKELLIQQLNTENTQAKSIQILSMKSKLKQIQTNKLVCKQQISKFETIYSQLKIVITQFFQKVDCLDRIPQNFIINLNQNNLLDALGIIQQKKNQLYNLQQQQQINNKYYNQYDLQDLMDAAKKQIQNKDNKNDHIFTRQQLLKLRQGIINRRKKDQKKFQSSNIQFKKL